MLHDCPKCGEKLLTEEAFQGHLKRHGVNFIHMVMDLNKTLAKKNEDLAKADKEIRRLREENDGLKNRLRIVMP